jgi:hypothetical protein
MSAQGTFPAQQRAVFLDRINQRTRWISVPSAAHEDHELDFAEGREFVAG